MKNTYKYCLLVSLTLCSVAAFAKPAYFTVENGTTNQLYVFGHGVKPPKTGGNIVMGSVGSSQGIENLYVGTVLNPTPASAVAVNKLSHVMLMADKEHELEKFGVFAIEDYLHRPICSFKYKNKHDGTDKRIVLSATMHNANYGSCVQKRLSYHRFEILVTPPIS